MAISSSWQLDSQHLGRSPPVGWITASPPLGSWMISTCSSLASFLTNICFHLSTCSRLQFQFHYQPSLILLSLSFIYSSVVTFLLTSTRIISLLPFFLLHLTPWPTLCSVPSVGAPPPPTPYQLQPPLVPPRTPLPSASGSSVDIVLVHAKWGPAWQ